MGKIVITEFVSLDGVIEDPGGHEGFRHGGWSFEIDRGEDGARFQLDEALATEALLLGRRTYEFLAAVWPSRGGRLADRLNNMPKYVVSSTLEDPGWNNSTLVRGDVVTEVSNLKRDLKGEINVPGSIRLARTLIEHDLVDELRLMVYPVVLGAGERLFGETSDKKSLQLVDTLTVGDGIVILSYRPARYTERPSDGASVREKRSAALTRAGVRESA
jgi:dihydrofolate reductase